MFNLRFTSTTDELRMGHEHTPYKLTKVTGIDGIPVTLVTSQGFDQIGETLDKMSVESRSIGIIGRIDNFEPAQLRAINNMFRPMTVVRMYFEDKYWIDCAVQESPVFTYNLRSVVFAVKLSAPYPFWKSTTMSFYRLGGTIGGFNFPVSYNVPHNFGLYAETLFLNCVNRGNTKVDYIVEMTCSSGTATNLTLTNAQNQKFIRVNTSITASDTVRIFRENNILRVTKTTNGITSDIFSALDEDSNLFWLDVGDNVLRADKESGDGVMIVSVSFYDTVTGVRYGI